MFYTISRPPSDSTWRMFVSLMQDYADRAEIYYMWSNPPDKLLHFLNHVRFEKPLVILGIKDLLDNWQEFNWWQDSQQIIPHKISAIAAANPDKQFVIFTSLENLNLEIKQPNMWIVPWGGDIVNAKNDYLNLAPVFDKNFNSDKHFICLNRHARDHRVITLSYLLGTGIADFGYISCLWNQAKADIVLPRDLFDRVSWEFDEPRHTMHKNILIKGYSQLSQISQQHADDWEIYRKHRGLDNDNASNFDKDLRPKYRNSFVEIVSESSFCAPSFNVTEKTANAFYACNFPILLGGSGIVQHMRDTGLDVFDDVIDHSYDSVQNPFDRIFSAIDRNRRLLLDGDWAKSQWQRCQSRFHTNLSQIKNIYQWYDHRTKQNFEKVIQNIRQS